jgi:hypothetical protein
MGSKKDNIIRVGDSVRVINPEMFVRCGYNLCLEDVYDKIVAERSKEIEDFVDKFFNKVTNINVTDINEKEENPEGIHKIFAVDCGTELSRTGQEIAKALAYSEIKIKGFGGKERKLFTKREEKFTNEIFYVHSIKIHKTGIYYPPGGGYYCGEYDYECGGLKNPKTHKILSVSPRNTRLLSFEDIRIEAIHVEKIIE